MSTNAHIFMMTEDGAYKGIYLHHDGYVEYTGKMLVYHYTDPEKVKELISLGHISVLGPVIGEKVNFDTYHSTDQCIAYTRDRGEDFVQYEEIDEDELFEYVPYVYLFKNGEWFCNDEHKHRWIPVINLLKAQEEEMSKTFVIDEKVVNELNKELNFYNCCFKFALLTGDIAETNCIKIVPKSNVFLVVNKYTNCASFVLSEKFYEWIESVFDVKYNKKIRWNSTGSIFWLKN